MLEKEWGQPSKEHRARHCKRRKVDTQACIKVGQFGDGKMRSFSSECFYFLSEIVSEVTADSEEGEGGVDSLMTEEMI